MRSLAILLAIAAGGLQAFGSAPCCLSWAPDGCSCCKPAPQAAPGCPHCRKAGGRQKTTSPAPCKKECGKASFPLHKLEVRPLAQPASLELLGELLPIVAALHAPRAIAAFPRSLAPPAPFLALRI